MLNFIHIDKLSLIKLLKTIKYQSSIWFIVIFTAYLLQVSSVYAAESMTNVADNQQKTLIVYYSRSGNTADVAQYIQEQTGGQLIRLETVNPYPEEYRATTIQARKELNEDYRPPLKTYVDNIAEYDVIFIGSPNWWGTMSMPVRTFLYEHDLTNKTLIPFITHEGSGLGRTINDLQVLAPNSKILDGLAIRGSSAKNSQQQVQQWLKRIGMTN